MVLVKERIKSSPLDQSMFFDRFQGLFYTYSVCGNIGAVKLMNEWMCQWRERSFQASQEFWSRDVEKSQDFNYTTVLKVILTRKILVLKTA